MAQKTAHPAQARAGGDRRRPRPPAAHRHDADPPVRGEGGRGLRPRQDRRLPASLHRRGGGGGGRHLGAATRRLRGGRLPRARPLPGQGRRPPADDGRAVRARRRAQQGQGRLDAPVRQGRQLPGRPRHRRQPPAAGHRGRLRHQVPRRRPGHRLLLRRRRGARGRVPRVDEPGLAVEAAGHLHLREQPLRHGHLAGAGPGRDRDLEVRARLQHGLRAGGRHGRAGRARGDGARGGPRADRAHADPHRGPHLPLPRPLHARSGRGGVPHQGRGREGEAARSHRAVPRARAARPAGSSRTTCARSRRTSTIWSTRRWPSPRPRRSPRCPSSSPTSSRSR